MPYTVGRMTPVLSSRYKFSGRSVFGCVALAGWMAGVASCWDGRAKSPSPVSSKDSGTETRLLSDSSAVGDGIGDSQGEQGRDVGTDVTRNPDEQAARDLATIAADGPAAREGGGRGETGYEAGPDVVITTSDVGREDGPGRRMDASADYGPDTQDVGAPSKDTGDASSGDTMPDTDPCAGGTTYAASTSARTTTSGYGWVLLTPPTSNNQVVEFRTVLTVPATPPATGTLFLWPGLQPLRGSANFDALNNGVLQPVLTWGSTCAPNSPAQSYKSWWISGQYVNTNIPSSSPNYSAYHDCHGGPGMAVAVGDALDLDFVLNGSSWTQTVTNLRNSQSVSFAIDLLGQGQNMAEFVIEEYSSKPVGDVIFTSSVITLASPAKTACQPSQRGINDYFSAPRASTDGLRCCIDKVTLRAEGVAATTPDSP